MTARARRLFFAVWPDEALRRATAAAVARAVAAAGGRVVPDANLHVTLAFLGGVPAERVADAIAAARRVPAVRGVQAFDRVAQWGRGGPLVLEASRLDPGLQDLQAALSEALAAAGFALDRRAFRPHITLSRRPDRRVPPEPPDTERGVLAWPFAGFVLVESETAAAGSRYTVVERFGAN